MNRPKIIVKKTESNGHTFIDLSFQGGVIPGSPIYDELVEIIEKHHLTPAGGGYFVLAKTQDGYTRKYLLVCMFNLVNSLLSWLI